MNTVILKMSEEKNKTHISLRESKLTRILGPLLLGEAKVIIIACLNPTTGMQEESLNTLKFSERCQTIVQALKKYNGLGETPYLWKYKSEMSALKEKLEGISGINSLQDSINYQDEEEKASLEIQLENLQNAILISEAIRDGKMQADEEQLWDFSERRSLRLKYWRESNSTIRSSLPDEVEEEEIIYPRISDVRMSIPEEPCVGLLSPFESKQHLEMFQYTEERALNLGSELLHKPGVPLPHREWLKLILDQESLITELQAQLTMKMQENFTLREEIQFCNEKIALLKAKFVA